MANWYITQRLESGTSLDIASATGTYRNLLVTAIRQQRAAGVLPAQHACDGHYSIVMLKIEQFGLEFGRSPAHEKGTQTGDDPIAGAQVRRTLAAAIEHQQLMPDSADSAITERSPPALLVAPR